MAETLLNQEETKIDTQPGTRRVNFHLKKIIGIVLFLVMVVLTVYALQLQNQNSNIVYRSLELSTISSERAAVNYRTYVEKYKVTKAQLVETTQKLEAVNHQLDQVTAQLTETQGMLTQTKGMLVAAQEENIKLRQELQGLDDLRNTENVQNMAELQDKIKTLKDKDSQISYQLEDLKKQLRAFEAQFSTPEEGQSLITLFQNKIRLVKSHLRYLKQEAYFAKVAAQKEKDRLAVLNGNSGYVIRNGQLMNPNGTKKTFAIDVKIMQ